MSNPGLAPGFFVVGAPVLVFEPAGGRGLSVAIICGTLAVPARRQETAMTDVKNGPIQRITKAIARVEANEVQATVLSFLFVFILMAGYFILRPVRDAMASDWSREEVGVLWTLTFFLSVFAVIAYGFLIARIRFRLVVPAVYGFFAASYLAFYALSGSADDVQLVRQVFYVWVSLFALFNTSVFWSYMSGLFNTGQAARLFGIIAAGASTGSLVGSRIADTFAAELGAVNLLPISAGCLLAVLPIIFRLEHLKSAKLGNASRTADLSEQIRLGKNPFSGIGLFLSDRYLLAIGFFILLYVLMGTFFYQLIREGLAPLDLDRRTEIRASIDFWVNLGTVLVAVLFTGRFASRFGVGATLASVPGMVAVGWFAIAATPVLAVVIAMEVVRRIGNYAVTRPGREMLFTAVDEETRFKAKPVVDIVVYRGGDVINVWFYNALTASWGLGLGLASVAVVAGVISVLWASFGVYLGRLYRRQNEARNPESVSIPA